MLDGTLQRDPDQYVQAFDHCVGIISQYLLRFFDEMWRNLQPDPNASAAKNAAGWTLSQAVEE